MSKAVAVMVARSERQRQCDLVFAQCDLVFAECDLMVVEKSY